MEWFRHSVEVRAAAGAERALRTAIHAGLPPETVAEMIFSAATDHRYLDGGHSLDFANKAFELLEHLGWDYAGEVLPSLVPHLVQGQRMEETSAWRDPIDVGALLDDADRELSAAVERGHGRIIGWKDHQNVAEQVLDGTPQDSIALLLRLVAEGAPLAELSSAVAYAAARRLAHFHTSNDFFDWDTVHHAFTYANAVDRALRRWPSPLLARGIFDAAMAVYLERFLNVPKQPLPSPLRLSPTQEEVLSSFDRQGQ
ncbi:MAG: Rieske (2Fe-2S) protein, partial [Dehalococcoidia bacterium]|nr:Rieske (2Fe-2S) protein [Dehalococcoidia bacterium]